MPKAKYTVEVNKKIGPRVKEARARIGDSRGSSYSQERLGVQLGYTGNMISQIEHGRRLLPREAAEAISRMSGLRVDYLLGNDDFRTNEEMLDALRSQLNFYTTWRKSLVELIAEQLEFQMEETLESETKYYIFKGNFGLAYRVPESEILLFMDEYYEYARFRIEQIIRKPQNVYNETKEEAGR